MSERGSKYSGPSHTRTRFSDKLTNSTSKTTITKKVNPAKKLEINLGDKRIAFTYQKTKTAPVKSYTLTTKNIGRLEQTTNNILSRLNSKTAIEYGTKARKDNTGGTVEVRKSNKLLSSSEQSRVTGKVTVRNVGLLEQAVDKGKSWMDRRVK